MAKVIWTARSLADMSDIGDFIAKNSPRYARMTIERFLETAKMIERNPRIGRMVPELNQHDIREVIQGNYRIIYQIANPDLSYILPVHHSSRLLSNNPIK